MGVFLPKDIKPPPFKNKRLFLLERLSLLVRACSYFGTSPIYCLHVKKMADMALRRSPREGLKLFNQAIDVINSLVDLYLLCAAFSHFYRCIKNKHACSNSLCVFFYGG